MEFSEKISERLLAINPFVRNVPILYPLKMSENLMVFRCFHGLEKRCIGSKWVNYLYKNVDTIEIRNRPKHASKLNVFAD